MAMKQLEKTELSISDDSGYLALLNADKYVSFIGPDWTYEQIQQRFTEQKEGNAIFIWATGGEAVCHVTVLPKPTTKTAFTEYTGHIEVTGECLYLANYEDLTMAAQFEDEKLPASHNSDLIIRLPNGFYKVTVRQLNQIDNTLKQVEGTNFEICLEAYS